MIKPDEVAQITAAGQNYTSWKSVMVRRVFGDAVSYFSFAASEPSDYGSGWADLKLKPGDPVQVSLGGVQVINGVITTRDTQYDARNHDLVLIGKSNTEPLAVSSIDIQKGAFTGTLEQIARGLIAPFNVGLQIINPPPIASKPFKAVYPQYGETPFELIERLSRLRGLIPTDDADGNLVLSQIDLNAAPVAELEEGRNIFSAHCRLDNQLAFGGYKYASSNVGDDQNRPPRGYAASATDPNFPANRLKTGILEHPGDAEDNQQRVNYEVARSYWPIVQATIVVLGWKKDDGSLWDRAQTVTVRSPMLFPNETGSLVLGIQSVTYNQDSENGTTTTLECCLPQALSTVGAPGVKTDASGGFVDNPKPNSAMPEGDDV